MLGFFLYILAASAIELLVRPSRKGWQWLNPAPTVVRLTTLALIFSIWLGLFGRVWLAAAFALATITIPCIASNIKRRILGEPLTFADLHLIGQVFAHPKLYYGDFLTHWRGLATAALAGVLATLGIFLWHSLEPAAISWPYRLGLIAIGPAFLALLRWPWFSRHIVSLLPGPAYAEVPNDAVRTWGLITSIVAQWIRWKNDAPKVAGLISQLPNRSKKTRKTKEQAPHIIAWQSESFVHPRRLLGLSQSLEFFDRTARKSALSGTLFVPAGGAYTMRTEFAFLTGLREEQLGLDRYNPYLRCDRWSIPSLPSTLRQHGYRTEFIHPHDLRFFRRDRVMPALGFENCFGEEVFDGALRCGPYISDLALASFVKGRLEAAEHPTFLFAVSMENHGPWPIGRLPVEHSSAEDVYLHHQRHADEAIAVLLDSFQQMNRPVVFCFYGDHPPLLPTSQVNGCRPMTDYFIHRTPGTGASDAHIQDLDVSSLSGALLREAARTMRCQSLKIPLAA